MKKLSEATRSALAKLSKARANLIMAQPFFGMLAMRMQMIEGAQGGTMETDGANLMFDTPFTNDLPQKQAEGVLGHEVVHMMLKHPIAMRDAIKNGWDQDTINRAMDYVVNPLVTDCKMELPDGALLDDQYRGKTWQEVYSLLPDQPGGGKCPGGKPGGDGDFGQLVPIPADMTAEQVAELDRAITQATAQAANACRQAGTLPGVLSDLCDDMFATDVPWQDILRRFMQDSAKDDYSWARPNRRFIAQGLYLPSLHSEGMGEISIAIDTSCSLSKDELKQIAGEVNEIKSTLRPSMVRVIYCDTQVQKVIEFGPYEEVQLTAHPGGGTDFNPPFDHLAEQGITPVCFIYFTDGHCQPPNTQPDYPVLWAITDTDKYIDWGEVVEISINPN